MVVRENIKHWSPMQAEKSQPSGQRTMPETRLTSFPALSVYLRVGISRSPSRTNDRFYFSYLFKWGWPLCISICFPGKQCLPKGEFLFVSLCNVAIPEWGLMLISKIFGSVDPDRMAQKSSSFIWVIWA